ncbi:DNA ligase [Rhodotorula toruloides]|nr:DNA ligase [Rhodotorula toruloides]
MTPTSSESVPSDLEARPPRPTTMDPLELHQPNSTAPSLAPAQVPYDRLLGTWRVVASTLPLWKNKRDVTITYTRIDGEEETTFDDLVKFSKQSAKIGSSQWEVKGVDRLERDLEGNGARWKWRGKGWLKISTSHWQLLGYSLSPSSPAATSDAPEWVVTYFSSTLFTPAGLDVYARTPTALSDDFVDDIVRKLEEMGGEVGQPVQNGGMFRIPHLEGNKALHPRVLPARPHVPPALLARPLHHPFPSAPLSSTARLASQEDADSYPDQSEMFDEALALHQLVHAKAITDKTPLVLGGAEHMDLPEPRTKLELKEEMEIGSESSGRSYKVAQFAPNAYSCTCLSWTMSRGRAVDVRSCKHLREILGDEHEDARCGPGVGVSKGTRSRKKAVNLDEAESSAPSTSKKKTTKASTSKKAAASAKKASENEGEEAVPATKKAKREREGGREVLLAKSFDLETKKQDPTGWWISEKLDGVRAFWDGKALWSRLPKEHELDGELFLGRNRFDETSGLVRRLSGVDWSQIRFMVFDIPSRGDEPFEKRQEFLLSLFPPADPSTFSASSAAAVNPTADETSASEVVEKVGDGIEKCEGWEHLMKRLEEVKNVGGEGLMLRKPGSKYEPKRSSTLLKVKTFYDAEALVVDHEPGKGKYEGMLGSLVCVMEDRKTQFKVGSGLNDDRRVNPPPIGSIITYRFQELTQQNVPRFPTFVGERFDVAGPKDAVIAPTTNGN